jgi:hypothetical protein
MPGEREQYWTQRDAAAFLGVSTRYLRNTACPKLVLPSTREHGRPTVRYVPEDVRAWAESFRSQRSVA